MRAWRVLSTIVVSAMATSACGSSSAPGPSTSGEPSHTAVSAPDLLAWTGDPFSAAGQQLVLLDGEVSTLVQDSRGWIGVRILDDGEPVREHPARREAVITGTLEDRNQLLLLGDGGETTTLAEADSLRATYDVDHTDLLVVAIDGTSARCLRGSGWIEPVVIATDSFCRLLGNGAVLVTSPSSAAILGTDYTELFAVSDPSVEVAVGQNHIAVVVGRRFLVSVSSTTGVQIAEIDGLVAPVAHLVLDDGTVLFTTGSQGRRLVRALRPDGTVAELTEGPPMTSVLAGFGSNTVVVHQRENFLTTTTEFDIETGASRQLASDVDAFRLVPATDGHVVILDGELRWLGSDGLRASTGIEGNRLEVVYGTDTWVVVAANRDGELHTTEVVVLRADGSSEILSTDVSDFRVLDSEAGGALVTGVANGEGSAVAHIDAHGSVTDLSEPNTWVSHGVLSTAGDAAMVVPSPISPDVAEAGLVDLVTGERTDLGHEISQIVWTSWWDDPDRDRTAFDFVTLFG